eukprot:12410470-Karenia_brevis.AAC.1
MAIERKDVFPLIWIEDIGRQGNPEEKAAPKHGPAPSKTKDIVGTIWFEDRVTKRPRGKAGSHAWA